MMNERAKRTGSWLALLVMALSLIVSLSAFAPHAAAEPITIDTFQGGLLGADLNFTESVNNTTLNLEIPRGAKIGEAVLTLEGVPAAQSANKTVDFLNTRPGVNLWAIYLDGLRSYPIDFDPYRTGWAPVDARKLPHLQSSDNKWWDIHTPGESLPPPLEWPVKLFHFKPGVADATEALVSWEGHSICKGNQTTMYHAEMWFWDHTSREWEMATQYSSNQAGDVYLNHTFDLPSPYVNANGSIPVAIVGIHAEGRINPPPVVSDNGHLYTDYISLTVRAKGLPSYPEDATLTVGDTEVFNRTGAMVGPETIGATQDLAGAIQAVIDSNTVMPGNLTIPLRFSVGATTGALLRVTDLEVTYQPVLNQPPEWDGPAKLSLPEDSPWTNLFDLDSAFNDDHNEGALKYEVVSNSEPHNLSLRVVKDPAWRHQLQAVPASDFFGKAFVVVRATDLFGDHVDSTAITVNVTQSADRPHLVDPGEQQATQGVPVDLVLEVDDPDLPDDELVFSDNSEHVDVDPSTGRILWTPGPRQIGRHQFSVTVTDRFGLDHHILLSFDVANVNDPPSIVSDLVVYAVQDEPLEYWIDVDDPDLPDLDTLTFAAFGEDVSVTCDPVTGMVTIVPVNANVPQVEVTLRVRDEAFEFDERTLTVNVENVNDPPSIEPLASLTFYVGDEVDVSLVFDDPDLHVDLSVAEVLSFSASHDGFAPDGEGRIAFVADMDREGTHLVTYTVTDLRGLSDSMEMTWSIVAKNHPPKVVTSVPSTFEAPEDQEFILQLTATDADGDEISWSDDADMFDVDPTTGRIAFTPSQGDVGTHFVILTVSDDWGGASTVSFQLDITNVNDAPEVVILLPKDNGRYREGETIGLEASATDADGDALTYTWMRGETAVGSGPVVKYDAPSPGRHRFRVLVSDGTVTTEMDVTVQVVEGEEASVVSATAVVAIAAIAAVAGLSAAALTIKVRRGKGA